KSTEHVERCHPWNHGAGTEGSRLRELGWQYGRCVPSATHRPGNLPAEATSFVGRRSELAELRKKLARARLVSLIGPGGWARPAWLSAPPATWAVALGTAPGWPSSLSCRIRRLSVTP